MWEQLTWNLNKFTITVTNTHFIWTVILEASSFYIEFINQLHFLRNFRKKCTLSTKFFQNHWLEEMGNKIGLQAFNRKFVWVKKILENLGA